MNVWRWFQTDKFYRSGGILKISELNIFLKKKFVSSDERIYVFAFVFN